MLLDNKEKEYLGKLEVGCGIVKLQGRWFSPFLIRIPLVRIKKGIVTDELIRRKMRTYSGYSKGWYREDRELSQIQDIPPREKLIQEQEKDYLIDILKNPLSGVVERNTRLKVSARRGNNLKELLVSKGLIETKEISTKSGRTVWAQLTKKGCNVLRKVGCNTRNGMRRYGLIHEFWRDKVRRYYGKLGYRVTFEKKLNGERADLVAEKGKKKIAIEIETGNSNAIENIKKCLDAEFGVVISVPVSRQIEAQIKERLKKEKLDERKRILIINSEKFG